MSTSTLIVDYLGVGLAAARPVTPNIPAAGMAFYYATDTVALSFWTGAAWTVVAIGAGAGTVTHTAGALTSHAPIVGNGSGDEKALAAMTNGQLMIGHTGADPDLATLTAGAGITITNAAGSVTIANSTLGTVTHTAGALTAHAPIVGAGSADEKALAAMTDGQLMIGHTGADPDLSTLVAGPGITIGNSPGAIMISVNSSGVIHTSGDLTANAIVVGGGANDIEVIGPLTNGQLIIGNTGNPATLAQLTAGSGISITNAPGSITIAVAGGDVDTLASLTDVTLTSLSATQMLQWNGSAWVNVAIPISGGTTGGGGSGVTPVSWLSPAALATAAVLPSCTYANGTLGVGATLTGTANGALSVDGVGVSNGQRILVDKQAAPAQNGMYVVTTVGNGGTPFVLTRVADFDQAAEITLGVAVFVTKGTTQAQTSWVMTQAAAVTVGTTAITFGGVASSALGPFTDSTGLSAALDSVFGNAAGQIIYRGSSLWTTLAHGSTGQYLQGGTVPAWSTAQFVQMGDVAFTSLTDKDFLEYDNGSSKWVNKTPAATAANLPAFAGSTQGMVPGGSGNDPTKVLSGSGTWVAGGGGSSTIAALTDVVLASLSDKDVLVYDSGTSKWKNQRRENTIAGGAVGVPQANQFVFFHRFKKAVTFPANFGAYLGSTSQAGGSANATASTVFDVAKAANATPTTFSSVGSVTIAAGSVTPTFATSGGTALSFAAGDVIRIRAPASPDASFADPYFTFVGYET